MLAVSSTTNGDLFVLEENEGIKTIMKYDMFGTGKEIFTTTAEIGGIAIGKDRWQQIFIR